MLGDAFGGLGFFIFEGWRRVFPTEIFAGATLTIVLAVTIDLLLVVTQRQVTPWSRPGTQRGEGRPDADTVQGTA